MNQFDEKVIAAMMRYDFSPIGSDERNDAADEIERLAAKVSDRDFQRIVVEYGKRLTARLCGAKRCDKHR